MKRIIAMLIATLALTSCGYGIGTPVMAHITTHNVPDGRCHEDDPCWNCNTMGNHVCGRHYR